MTHAQFLFDPEDVSKRISSFVHLKAALGDPRIEGEVSVAFQGARRSPREIYRVLGNLHYPHLDRLVQTLDFCLGHGYTQPTVLRTRARKTFVESLAELQAAEHCLLRGFRVRGLDADKQAESVPDLIINGHCIEVAVEVYCPRRWEGLDDFRDDLKDAIQNLDASFDYEVDTRFALVREFDTAGRLFQLHPGELAQLLTREIREDIVAAVLSKMEAKLGGANRSFTLDHRRADLNIAIILAINTVKPSSQRLPVRRFSYSGPPITGYAPEQMFRQIVDRVRRKATKRQAVGHAQLSLLLVDLSRSQLTPELEHPGYLRVLAQSVDAAFPNGPYPYDMIALGRSLAWGHEFKVLELIRGRNAPLDMAPRLFDQIRSPH